MALKAARAHTGRPKIAKCEGAYHGSYDYAEVSLDPTPEAWGRNAPVSVAYAKGTPDNVLADVVTIPFNDTEAAVSLIREHGPELACVLVDPMPNRAGLAPADQAYLEALRKVTREVGALSDLRRGHHVSARLSRRAGHLEYRPRSDHARKDHRRRLSGRRDRRPQGSHGGVRSAPGQAGAAAWRHVLRQSGDDARRDRRDGAARRRGVSRGSTRWAKRFATGIDAAFRRHGVPGGTVGLGSLLKIHFADRPVRDYRSALSDRGGSAASGGFLRALLNRGVRGRGLWIDGIVDPDDGCRYTCDHRCGVGRARGSRTHALPHA